MKVTSIVCGVLLLLVGHVYAAEAPKLERLDLPLKLTNGETTTLRELTRKGPVYVKFWATWCQPCMEQMAHYEATHKKYGDKLNVIGVNVWVNESHEQIDRVVEEKALTLPIAIDYEGELAQAFNFMGTPYHMLLDQQGRLVHGGYEANADIDNKISLLVKGELADFSELAIDSRYSDALLQQIEGVVESDQETAILFTATWCDWYLEETRPTMSKNCENVQKWLAEAYKQQPDLDWHTVVTRLWTGEKDKEDYVEKYGIQSPVYLDAGNTVFTHYEVKNFPTLIVFKNGKEVSRINRVSSSADLVAKVNQAL